jgi:hypothetical protein
MEDSLSEIFLPAELLKFALLRRRFDAAIRALDNAMLESMANRKQTAQLRLYFEQVLERSKAVEIGQALTPANSCA